MLSTWQEELKLLVEKWGSPTLQDLFLQDPQRVEKYHLDVNDIYLDYSKNFLDDHVFSTLIAVAKRSDLANAISRLLAGEIVNVTENRPAHHTALRAEKIKPAFLAERQKMSAIVKRLQDQQWLGATGKPIQDIVNLGIGGSDLGPKMVVEALACYHQGPLNIHFVSNIDPVAIAEKLEKLDPATTLFIISSKSFTTPETLLNAAVAREWIEERVKGRGWEAHFIAVTAKPERAKVWGIGEDNILSFDEGIGGRYSVWSNIGISVALSVGMEHFEAFLAGARAMDDHFETVPFERNMPVILALIGMWYIHGFKANTLAILPYAHGLRSFADYLQQLDMESNGKSVQINGEKVKGSTGPIIWGQVGTNGQHAFYQLLHQGTHFIPVDFIVCATSQTDQHEQHQQFVANALAQAQALMLGEKTDLPHHHMPGNKPSNMIVLKKLTPFALGELLALYEHKIFVQGILWEINSFDQPGVELGKKLSDKILQSLRSADLALTNDPSTRKLISVIQRSNGAL